MRHVISTHASDGEAGVELAEREAAEAAATTSQPVYETQQHFFRDRRRFFQLSNDLTTLRWSWKEYLLLDEVVKATSLQPYVIEAATVL